jgi:hypothetical protein
MKELSFSIPVSGVIRIDGNSVVIVVNGAETTVSLSAHATQAKRTWLEAGKSVYEVILDTARQVVQEERRNRFSTPELFYAALRTYPDLNKASFTARVIASCPDHPSFRHHQSRRDYFSRLGTGQYRLNERYLPNNFVSNPVPDDA